MHDKIAKVNADLHCHSTFSDGLLCPADLAERARNRGVELLAVTDHDDVSALAEMREACRERNLRFVDGVEISCSWGDVTVHILGLGIDPGDRMLTDGLTRIRESRAGRARDMSESLAKAGIEGSLEGALAYAGNRSLVSRTHFARFLAAGGHASNVKSVFRRYLAEGKPGYVPHQWASIPDAVQWIRHSGGVAVVAHPGRYALSAAEMRAFLVAFRELGGSGVEVVSGAHSPDQCGEFAALARELGLSGSRGSDFHGPGESRVDLGAMPPLPSAVTPVWNGW